MIFFIYLSFLFCFFDNAFSSSRPKPNIVVIFVDDFGWQDVKSFEADGQKDWNLDKSWSTPYETPFMDILKASGMSFVQGYSSSPVCSPSRGALLAGKSPVGLGRMHVLGGNQPDTGTTNLILPYYLGRMPETEVTIAEALNTQGYLSGHVGKWHAALDHVTFPNAQDQGFYDFYNHSRGVTSVIDKNTIRSDRIKEEHFGTWDENNEYKLSNYSEMYMRHISGFNSLPKTFPHHELTESAVSFIEKGVEEQKPFFLYMATWLVHTPIHTRNRALLDYYVNKMFGSNTTLEDLPSTLSSNVYTKQKNPYYASMVTTLDWSIGRVWDILSTTEDPRWPGHKLIENTYIIFTADNGGLEKKGSEHVTDNFPLSQGKHYLKEGGIRVPYIVVGPDISADVVNNKNMVIGYDIYPTILDLVGLENSEEQQLEGVSLKSLLLEEGEKLTHSNHPYFKNQNREVLIWHYPKKNYSTIRKGAWKLIKNYDHSGIVSGGRKQFELYKLYQTENVPLDLSEQNDLSSSRSDKVEELNNLLVDYLITYEHGEIPYYNPNGKEIQGAEKNLVPTIEEEGIAQDTAWIRFKMNGASVNRAYLLYNLGRNEWFRIPAQVNNSSKIISAKLPKRTLKYQFNIVDENNYFVASGEKSSNLNDEDCPIPSWYVGEDNLPPILIGGECLDPVHPSKKNEQTTKTHQSIILTEKLLILYDLKGRKVWSENVSNTSSLLKLKPGVYFAHYGSGVKKYLVNP